MNTITIREDVHDHTAEVCTYVYCLHISLAVLFSKRTKAWLK